ncbi:MAG: hypothetical protein HOE76_06975 [Euryarchaeota archaeon]|nr:hypothetical protein [Euryarchaeota archaeon]MBT5185000.1 hypothetical protein [Euryarchaeota archaeon]
MVSISVYTYSTHRFPPMIIALLLAVLLAPVLSLLTRAGNLREHAIGIAVVCIPMAGLWSIAESYFNIAIPFLVWVWQCASWSKTDHPPFRYGIWHGFGITFGIIPGAMLYSGLFQ